MRILVGAHEIGRQVYDLANGFRRLGHDVDTVMAVANPYLPELQYNHVFNPTEFAALVHAAKEKPYLHYSDQMVKLRSLLKDYDVYVFNFASSLLPRNADYPQLKRNGKKIVSFFQGSDIRHWSAAEPVAEEYGYRIPSMYRTPPYNHLGARMLNLRMGERFADAVFSLPFQSELAIRPYYHILLPVDLSLYKENIPARDVPVLVHAPSRRNFKGTDTFLEVLDHLRAEGVNFELKLLENVPNREVIRSLVDADVVLDELNAPHYAMLALEGMATGCVVVAGCDHGYVPMQGDSPVYPVRIGNVHERLKRLLTDTSLRLHHARLGRAFVKAHHDHVQVAARVLATLDSSGGSPDYYPTFYATKYRLPAGEVLPDDIARWTTDIIQRYGLPEGVGFRDLVQRGLSRDVCPDRPVVNWKSTDVSVKEEIWGWSPEHREPNVPASERASGVIIQLAQKAIQSVIHGDHDTADAHLQKCIAYANKNEEGLEDVDAKVAIGRLAQELGESELAANLYKQAHEQTPDRDDLKQVSETLTEAVRYAA